MLVGTEAKILPTENPKPGKEARTRVSPRGVSCPPGDAEEEEGCRAGRAGSGSERGRTERGTRSHGRSGGGARSLTVALPPALGGPGRSLLPPPPPSGLQPGAEDRIETFTAATSTVEAPRTEPGNPGARGYRLQPACAGCRRAVAVDPGRRGPPPAGWREAGRGSGGEVSPGAVGRQSRGPGLPLRGTLPVFPGGHFSTKLSTAQVKVLGFLLFGWSQAHCARHLEHCAALKSGFSKNQPAWRSKPLKPLILTLIRATLYITEIKCSSTFTCLFS